MSRMKVAETEKVEKQLKNIVVGGETIVKAFRLSHDFMVFTNLRVITVDKQGLSGKKREFISLPYKSILFWSVESNRNFEFSGALRLYAQGAKEPFARDFKSSEALYEVQKILVTYCR